MAWAGLGEDLLMIPSKTVFKEVGQINHHFHASDKWLLPIVACSDRRAKSLCHRLSTRRRLCASLTDQNVLTKHEHSQLCVDNRCYRLFSTGLQIELDEPLGPAYT